MIAFGGIFIDSFAFESGSFDVETIDDISLLVLDRYFNASMTLRAPNESKPVVGSSQNIIGGFVNNWKE